jgi:exopolysaccharide production protein ExoQ
MNKLLSAEWIFTIVSLLHYTGGPIVTILAGGSSEGDESAGIPDYDVIKLICFVNYAISLVLLLLRWKKVTYVLSKDRHILVMLGLCGLSYFWSELPDLTLIRTVAMIGTSLFGIYIATLYTPKEQLQLLAWTFGIAIGLSIIFAIFLPKYGVMSGIHSGTLRGIYTHKNVLGKLMILSGIVFLLGALNDKKNRFILWSGLILSIVLLLSTKSSSSIISFVIVLGIFFVLRILLLNYNLLFPALFFLMIVGQISFLCLTNNTEIILSSVGKDATLTGREPLWNATIGMIWRRPWFGYGFSGFWKDWDAPSAVVWRIVGWTPPNAHNGFLDICLDLGLIGFAIFLIGFITNLIRGLRWIRICRTTAGFWPATYMIYFWLSNQSESSLLRPNEIFWLLYVTVIISMLTPPEK